MTKRKKRHSPEQIVRKIQQADRILAEGGDVAAVLRELNVTEATYYRWRNHYGGLKAEDAKKLKHPEKQNLQLKKLLAEAELEKAVLKELAERVGVSSGKLSKIEARSRIAISLIDATRE